MRKKQKAEERPGSATGGAETVRVTPVDIQQKEFRVVMRGYSERDVDQFLDEVTEEVARLYAENRRLREEADVTRTIAFDPSGATEAEALVRQAREEAERILADARSQAAVALERAAEAASEPRPEPPASPFPVSESVLSPFVARERAFLQNLAGLIQRHADGVKEDIRRTGQPRRASMETGPPAVRAERPHDVVVVGESPAPAGELAPAFARRHSTSAGIPEHDQEDDNEDRSLRELFWGQD